MNQPQPARPVYWGGGTFPWRLLFVVIAIVLFGIAGALFEGWFTDTTAIQDGLGLIAFGLASFAVAHV